MSILGSGHIVYLPTPNLSSSRTFLSSGRVVYTAS